jgi:hypothetical protein
MECILVYFYENNFYFLPIYETNQSIMFLFFTHFILFPLPVGDVWLLMIDEYAYCRLL